MSELAANVQSKQKPTGKITDKKLKPLAVKSLRQRMGWTQMTMARFLGLSVSQYTRLEYGKGGVQRALLARTERNFQSLKAVADAGRKDEVPVITPRDVNHARKLVYDIAHSIVEPEPMPSIMDDNAVRPKVFKMLREELGWTQSQMAACLLYHRSYVSHIESGDKGNVEWELTAGNIFRVTVTDCLLDIIGAMRGDEIPQPIEGDIAALEVTWRTIFNLAHEVRTA